MKEKPRFFCDNCGQEVGNSAKTCPYCGRFFASIRCPACGFSGEDRLFVNGCPSCGYSTSSPVPQTAGKPKKKRQRVKKKHPPAEPLPVSIYIILTIALLIVITVLSHLITR